LLLIAQCGFKVLFDSLSKLMLLSDFLVLIVIFDIDLLDLFSMSGQDIPILF
jgi:hypothetical protein